MQYLVKSKLQRLTPMEELMALLKDKGLMANAAVNTIKRAASKVPLLHNKLQSVPYYNVAKLKLSIINHYRQLTDMRWG